MREQSTAATQAVWKMSLGRSPQAKLPMQARTLSNFSREGGCGKVQCQLDSVAALNPKWHVGKQITRVVKAIVMSYSQAISKQLGEDLLHPTTHTCLGVS